MQNKLSQPVGTTQSKKAKILNLNFLTPKTHFLARNRVIWAIVRKKIGSVVLAVGDDKNKQEKERYKKVTKALYFTCSFIRILTKFST